MKRLIAKNINTAEEYNRIFNLRNKKGLDDFDLKRWIILLKHYKGGRLIDLGCLDSLVAVIAKAKSPLSEIWGLDNASIAIKSMQQRYPKIFYHVGDIYNTKFNHDSFDYVVMGEVLEHLEEPQKAIDEAMRIVKSGGRLAISVPLDEAREFGAKDADRHLWSFTEKDLHKMLEPYGAVETEVMGSQMEPYIYNFPNLIAFCTKK